MMFIFITSVIVSSLRDGMSPIMKIAAVTILLGMVAGGSSIVGNLPDIDRTIRHFDATDQEIISGSWNGRGPATLLSLEMIKDRPWYGWGAASWRFIFPYYQIKVPEMVYNTKGEFRIWEDAHNDWAQYASEFGIVGLPFLLAFVLWPVGYVLFHIRSARLTQLILICTFLGLFFHSIIELLLQNAAILCLGGLLIVMLVRLPWSKRQNSRNLV
jgi:O-antigen ligase